MPIASLRQIRKTYGEPGAAVRVEALTGIDLEFDEGDFIAVCGQSGSGKSTLMNLIGCLDRPSAGQYLNQWIKGRYVYDRVVAPTPRPRRATGSSPG